MEKLLLDIINTEKGNLEVKDFAKVKETLTNIVAKDYQVPEVINGDNYVSSKDTRAKLNNITKLISARKTEMRKKALEIVEVAETQLKELATITDVVSDLYDEKIKGYEVDLEANRIKKAQALWLELKDLNTHDLSFEVVMAQVGAKWVNATTTEKQIKDDVSAFYKMVDENVEMVKVSMPEYANFVVDYYLTSFDMLQATRDGKKAYELANKHLEDGVPFSEEEIEENKAKLQAEEVFTLTFTIKTTRNKISQLQDFINHKDIELISVKKGE